ncbi:MAG: hypothetical protein AB7O49_06220 [Sphingomonadales bacterium]
MTDTRPLRVLFCIGITQTFFDLSKTEMPAVFGAFKTAFGNLERLGVTVLGSLDDDRAQVGHSGGWPWTSYIMADVPDFDTVVRVCDLLRSTPAGDGLLWRYAKIEARIGRPVFTEESSA